MAKILLKIEGMSCNHCKQRLEQLFAGIKGIDKYTVSLEKGVAEISGTPDIQQVIAAIQDLGYTARIQ